MANVKMNLSHYGETRETEVQMDGFVQPAKISTLDVLLLH
jgi:hypothetical protein